MKNFFQKSFSLVQKTAIFRQLRDWSLNTGRGGGLQNERGGGGGGACEVLPLRKGGWREHFLKGGGHKYSWVSFYAVA